MSDVHPALRNAVIAAIWLTVVVPVAAAVVSVSIYAVRYALNGTLTTPDVALGPQTQLLLILAVVGGYGFLIWLVARETFGAKDVDQAAESAVETAEDAQETIDNLE